MLADTYIHDLTGIETMWINIIKIASAQAIDNDEQPITNVATDL